MGAPPGRLEPPHRPLAGLVGGQVGAVGHPQERRRPRRTGDAAGQPLPTRVRADLHPHADRQRSQIGRRQVVPPARRHRAVVDQVVARQRRLRQVDAQGVRQPIRHDTGGVADVDERPPPLAHRQPARVEARHRTRGQSDPLADEPTGLRRQLVGQSKTTRSVRDPTGQRGELDERVGHLAGRAAQHPPGGDPHRLHPLGVRQPRDCRRDQIARGWSTGQLLQREHRLPPMGAGHRLRRRARPRPLTADLAIVGHRHPDRQAVLPDPYRAPAARLGRRDSLPRRQPRHRARRPRRRPAAPGCGPSSPSTDCTAPATIPTPPVRSTTGAPRRRGGAASGEDRPRRSGSGVRRRPRPAR